MCCSALLSGGYHGDASGVGTQECFLLACAGSPAAKSGLASAAHAPVTSKLTHCNALYMGLPGKMVRKLQLEQKTAARTPEPCDTYSVSVMLAAYLFPGPI